MAGAGSQGAFLARHHAALEVGQRLAAQADLAVGAQPGAPVVGPARGVARRQEVHRPLHHAGDLGGVGQPASGEPLERTLIGAVDGQRQGAPEAQVLEQLAPSPGRGPRPRTSGAPARPPRPRQLSHSFSPRSMEAGNLRRMSGVSCREPMDCGLTTRWRTPPTKRSVLASPTTSSRSSCTCGTPPSCAQRPLSVGRRERRIPQRTSWPLRPD